MKIFHMRKHQDFELYLFNSLKKKGFLFVVDPKTIPSELVTREQPVTEWAHNYLYLLFSKTINQLYSPPEIAQLSPILAQDEIEQADESELEIISFIQQLQSNFSLSGIKFGKNCISYLACIDCDCLSEKELIAKAQKFTETAPILKNLADNRCTKLLGIKQENHEYLVFNSLCLVFSDPGQYRQLKSTVESIKLNQGVLPEFLLSGFKNSLFFDKITYCLFDNKITGSQLIRSYFHFGCSLSELVMK
jgi:hypothetical protein